MNEISYRAPQFSPSETLHAPLMQTQPAAPAVSDEATQRMLADLRRDMQQQIDWQARQQQVTVRRGPSAGEAGLVLGSLAVGAVMTSVLITNATTVSQGLFGTQRVSHADILPFVLVIWLALLAINVVWARRR